ncbi:hypothetical protein WJX72_008979 [[Myrmecia] bisecta]|uniref:Uncharacterized protein n=1 Tax=[Myrmecia] bisecta TaxID=41462 RepID=A0AAW1R8L0_9CHLO
MLVARGTLPFRTRKQTAVFKASEGATDATRGSAQRPTPGSVTLDQFAQHFDTLYEKRCDDEHPTDADLAFMVEEVHTLPLYQRVRAAGNCNLECFVVDKFQDHMHRFHI